MPENAWDTAETAGTAVTSTTRGTTVELCPDGPMLVRGPATIVGADGAEIPRRRGTVALCRCRGTRIPPWCDGTHRALAARRGPTAQA